jgi:hypothetical protein
MTVYEKMSQKLELLKEAEIRCINKGRMNMAFVWRMHQLRLKEHMYAMPVSLAVMEESK